MAEKVAEKEEDHEKIAQQFVDEWNWWQTVLYESEIAEFGGYNGGHIINDAGLQGVRRILDGGWDKTYRHLKKYMLRNGATPGKMLSCVYLREVGSRTWLTDNN